MVSRSNPSAKLAMQNAWRLVREGQAIYGGSRRQYIREALKIAWAELKANPVHRACLEMIASLRAEKRQPKSASTLSPGLQAAANRWAYRNRTRAYGASIGAARFTAAW
jgi:Streptococcus thermophilus bacteriophage Gp111 protein